ncbi:MAG: hypothetical protein WAM94_02080 [Chromatiaceae bacterium]
MPGAPESAGAESDFHLVVLIAEPKALAVAVKRAGAHKRLTKLRERLASTD